MTQTNQFILLKVIQFWIQRGPHNGLCCNQALDMCLMVEWSVIQAMI